MRNLTPREQGYRWRQAGGLLHHCWYRKDSAEWALFEQGFKQASIDLLALLKSQQATDNTIEGEGDN